MAQEATGATAGAMSGGMGQVLESQTAAQPLSQMRDLAAFPFAAVRGTTACRRRNHFADDKQPRTYHGSGRTYRKEGKNTAVSVKFREMSVQPYFRGFKT